MNRPALAVLIALTLGACEKKSEDATVLEKSYIPAHVEGTEYQERQTDRERWLVLVETANGRKFHADVDPELWKALKVGDSVRAHYSQGKYTGTVWASELQRQ